MEKIEYSPLEKEMISFNFNELNSLNATAKANISAATSPSDVIAEICKIWKLIRKFVIALEVIPVAGKFITIFAELLDALCPTS